MIERSYHKLGTRKREIILLRGVWSRKVDTLLYVFNSLVYESLRSISEEGRLERLVSSYSKGSDRSFVISLLLLIVVSERGM